MFEGEDVPDITDEGDYFWGRSMEMLVLYYFFLSLQFLLLLDYRADIIDDDQNVIIVFKIKTSRGKLEVFGCFHSIHPIEIADDMFLENFNFFGVRQQCRFSKLTLVALTGLAAFFHFFNGMGTANCLSTAFIQ